MKKYALILLFCCMDIFAFAQGKQAIKNYAVTYKVKHLGFSSTGKFGKLSGEVLFDQDHLSASNITAVVETNSFDSDNSMRDKDLKSDKYFDVEHYPKIIMRSVSFSHAGGGNYLGEFDLTIKGKTKRIELPFVYTLKGAQRKFEGSFTINRVDYGVGSSNMMLSDDVTVSISLQTTISN